MGFELSFGNLKKFQNRLPFYPPDQKKIKVIFCSSKDYNLMKSICECVVVVDRRKKNIDQYRNDILLNSKVGDSIVSINQGDIIGKLCVQTGRTFLGMENEQTKMWNVLRIAEEERKHLREHPENTSFSLFQFL